jgi:hypothetical protein
MTLLAIRHELAHALCNDPDEAKADRAAIALKNGTPSVLPSYRAGIDCESEMNKQEPSR